MVRATPTIAQLRHGLTQDTDAAVHCPCPLLLQETLTKIITIQPQRIGQLIGKHGAHLQRIRNLSGAKIKLNAPRPCGTSDAAPAVIEITCSCREQMAASVQLVVSASMGGFISLYNAACVPIHPATLREIEEEFNVKIHSYPEPPPSKSVQVVILPFTSKYLEGVPKAASKLLLAQRERKVRYACVHLHFTSKENINPRKQL
jgi:predicted RNA-binding protein YlqC (UPF0109 family)